MTGDMSSDQIERDIKNDLKDLERLKPRSYFLRLSSLLGIGTLFDGLDSAIIGSIIPALIVYLHIGTTSAGALAGSVYVGEIFGSLIFGYLTEKLGRKNAFIISILQYSVFVILTGAGWNYASIYAFRLISGFGLGGEVAVAMAMFSEFVPTRNRGLLTNAYESLYAWGLFLAPLIGAGVYALVGEAIGWRVLFYLGAIPLVAGIVSIFALYESPRWLLNKGRIDEGRAIIKRLQAKSKGERHDSKMSEIDKEIENAETIPKKTRFAEMFSKQYRRRTASNWVIWFTAYFVNYGVLIWLPTLYVRIGGLPVVMSLELTAFTAGLTVLFGTIMFFIIDKVGRKSILLFGYCLALVGLIFGIVEALIYHDVHWQILLIAASLSFVGNGGLMALPLWNYTTELFPTRMRGWATSSGKALSSVAIIISLQLTGIFLARFAPAYHAIGYVFIVFAVMMAIGLIVTAIFGIETKQKLLEQLSP